MCQWMGPMHHPSQPERRSEDLILVKLSERRKLGTSGESANRAPWQVPWCWAVRQRSLFLTVVVACWKSLCSSLAVLLLMLREQRRRWVICVLPPPPFSWGTGPSVVISPKRLILCWKTQQTFDRCKYELRSFCELQILILLLLQIIKITTRAIIIIIIIIQTIITMIIMC